MFTKRLIAQKLQPLKIRMKARFIIVDDFVSHGYGKGIKRAVQGFCDENGFEYQDRMDVAVIAKGGIRGRGDVD